jgi:N-acetylglutamate synthase-like GNAT family acetyltransferase
MPAVVDLDAKVTRLAKPDYWADVFAGSQQEKQRRHFLIAEENCGTERRFLGFIIGEVRAWEFGSAPCGWVFALSVDPSQRLSGAGSALFAAISAEFKKAGVGKIRTMVARDTRLPMLFFRSEGMRAGPYLQLEKEIE